MIHRGADINAKVGEDGSSPLHFAAMNGHQECVEILLAKKVTQTYIFYIHVNPSIFPSPGLCRYFIVEVKLDNW